MNNRDVFISDSIILAGIFFLEQGDWIYVGYRLNPRTTVPTEVPSSQDRKVERPPKKFNTME